LKLALASLCAALLLAAAPESKSPKIRRTELRVPAWLETAQPAGLRASLAGKTARVLAVAGPGDDLMLLIVLDLAGDLALADPARQSLVEQLGALGPRTWVGLMRSQDGLQVLLDPTRDRSAAAGVIEQTPVSGKAGLLDTLEVACGVADSVLRKSKVRVALLYVTDSDVRNYREDFSNPVINSSDSGDLSRRFPEALVQEKIQKLNAVVAGRETPVFIVHLDYRSDRLNEAYQIGLQQLAETAGGQSAFCRSVAEIPSAIREMLTSIEAHSSVTVELPAERPDALEVKLGVAANSSGEATALRHRKRFVLRKDQP